MKNILKRWRKPITKTTILNGFHMIYPNQPLFERFIEDGRKEVVELCSLLPTKPSGGYEAVKYTITITETPIRFVKD